MLLLTGIGRLFTATAAGTLVDAAIVVDGNRIHWVGPSADGLAHAGADPDVVDLEGGLVTAGLVDAHTHPVYAGSRTAEIAARSAGASYAELAAAGGGIVSTVRATRAAPLDELRQAVAERLAGWLAHGTTTVEAKTGYHLDEAGELAAVRLLAELDAAPGLPNVAVTFLGAHAVPPESPGGTTAFAVEVAGWCAAAAEAGAQFVDVFCDEGYFSVDDARTVLTAGRAAGLDARVHADELAHTGGAKLAAEVRAASADHLLRIDADDAAALAAAGVTAVLCPGTALSLGVIPPARLLLDTGVTVALGTDHNPGTSGLRDMTVVVALAVAALGLSVDEALFAATAGGGTSLRRPGLGTVAPGAPADVVAWDADHEGAFAWAWGVPARRVWLAGREQERGSA